MILGILLGACTSRPQRRVEMTVPETAPSLPPIVETYPLPEQLARQVKQNGQDIKKYFYLDEDGKIVIKADLQEGNYEVFYDLEGAEALTDSVYSVGFSIREKEKDTIIEDRLIWKPGPGKAGLLLAMDDDYMEIWEQYFDLFDEYGARITFFIQGGGFNSFSFAALSRGHDVGFHSLNHLDLRKISREAFFEETSGAVQSFRKEGIPLSSFAYPYGFSEPWMHEILLESFGVLRGYGTTFRLYNEDQIRSGYIISRAIDNTVIRGEEKYNRLIGLMLKTVKFLDDGRILPITTHDISDTAHWGITPRRLEFLLKTAADLNLVFYRYSDFAENSIN